MSIDNPLRKKKVSDVLKHSDELHAFKHHPMTPDDLGTYQAAQSYRKADREYGEKFHKINDERDAAQNAARKKRENMQRTQYGWHKK